MLGLAPDDWVRATRKGVHMKWKHTARWVLAIVLVGTLTCSCATVPREAVELSQLVGHRITDMQISHEAFVAEYFRVSRERIEDYLEQQYVPLFLENLVRDADLQGHLSAAQPFTEEQLERLRSELEGVVSERDQEAVVTAVSSAFGDAERGQIVLEFAQAAMREIDKKRGSLLGPLADQEARALSELRAAYAELTEMQSTVTSHLGSVRDVQMEQEEILSRLGMLKQRDAAISAAAGLNDAVLNAIDKGESAEKTIEELKSILDGGQ